MATESRGVCLAAELTIDGLVIKPAVIPGARWGTMESERRGRAGRADALHFG